MQKQSQPQTTSNSNVRDASVQISAGRHTPKEWKFEKILKGIRKIAEEKNPRKANQDFWEHQSSMKYGMACELTMIIQNLTSTKKEERKSGKEKVRELVKLGQEAEE